MHSKYLLHTKMKRKLVLFLCYFAYICSYGQLQGSFNYAQDGHIYFYLSNPTGYQIPVTWGVYNFRKNEQRVNQGVMTPYSTFTYGPNMNWIWEKDERFVVTYANGQTVYWTCPETDPILRNRSNISFGSGSRDWNSVSVTVSKCKGFAGSLCSCKVYKGEKRTGLNQYRGNCSNIAGGHQCNHGPAAHGLTAY